MSWVQHGISAIVDQGCFGIGNFGLNVMLARTLGPYEYGAFATAYSLFVLISVGHTALISQPLVVFGAAKYGSRQHAYFRGVLLGHWLLTAAAGTLLLIMAAAVAWGGNGAVARALVAVAFASPFLLLQWLMRRICYVRLEPRTAAAAGGAYLVILFSGIYVLARAGALSVTAAFALMAVASVLSILPILWPILRASGEGVRLREIAGDHLRFGRWTVATGFVEVAGQSVYFLLLPLMAGLESAAALKALLNLEMPLLQAFSALSVLLVGALVRLQGGPAFARTMTRVAVLFTAIAVAYWLALGLNADAVFGLVYGDRYAAHGWLLWTVGLLPVGAGLCGVLGAALHALRRPDLALRAALAAAGVALTVGVALSLSAGVAGAAAGLVLGSAVTVLVLQRSLRPVLALPGSDLAGARP